MTYRQQYVYTSLFFTASAINKRSNQSASPPLPDTRKNRRRRTSNDTQLLIEENKSEQNAVGHALFFPFYFISMFMYFNYLLLDFFLKIVN